MNKSDAMAMIVEAVRRAVKDKTAEVPDGADLLEQGILDSLDGMVFLLELSNLSGKEFPEQDLEEAGFYKVDRLIKYLTA